MIVVGVDGSECSNAALHFALEEARVRHARLRIVVAWHVPLAAYGAGWAPPPPGLSEDVEAAAEEVLKAARALCDEIDGEVEIETVATEGHPAQVLVEEAEGAELLVVGCRGRGGFRELMLGSVSHQCALHARCPVAIVRAGCECPSDTSEKPC
jgi:nucleotide-binding universal stress UspA family protein